MNTRRITGIAGVIAAFVFLAGCGGDDPSATSSTLPAASATGGSSEPDKPLNPGGAIMALNNDAKLFAAANPCKLVTSTELTKLFEGTFTNVLGTDESPVTDHLASTRACGYNSSNARIDHEGSYDITDVALIITTSLDDEKGTLWRANLDATSMGSGEHAAMPGADDLIRIEPGWYTARKGQVIIEVSDINSKLTDEGAKRILAGALAKLP